MLGSGIEDIVRNKGYMQAFRRRIIGEDTQAAKYIITEMLEQKDIDKYVRAGINIEHIVSVHQYFTDNRGLRASVKVEDKLKELKNKLHYTNISYQNMEIWLSKEGYVIASILLDEKDKDYFGGILYFSRTKLVRMEVYRENIVYANYYMTANSQKGAYAKLVRRTFYNTDGTRAYDEIFRGNEETYLFSDGRDYTKMQFRAEFIKRLKLSMSDTVLIDRSVPGEFVQALFRFGNNAKIIAIIHGGHLEDGMELRTSVFDECYYYWFKNSKVIGTIIVSTQGQKEELIKIFQESGFHVPDIRMALVDGTFNSTALYESYGGKLALSWNFNGKPDGFLIYDDLGRLIYETRNCHKHYYLIKKCEKMTGFIIKAFVDTLKGKLIIAETEKIYLRARQYGKPEVSLIIPAYNAEDYIARSIDTALAQSFMNLEIVIVDDGSTDSTSDIIDWYANKYPNVLAIHKENGGVAAARNIGIEQADGEYIGFMDNDDMIRPDMIMKLHDSIKKNECDVAITSVCRINNGIYEKFIQYPLDEDVAMTTDEFFDMHFTKGCMFAVVIWNKLYKASLVKQHLIPVLIADDNAWTPYVLSYTDKICYLNGYFYEWDRTVRSSTQVDEWNRKSKEETFHIHKNTIMFYLEEGNPQRLQVLKRLAKRQLTELGRAYAYDEYEKLSYQIG
ncbi:MAG: glycosyltransferase [Ruminococcus sp.]|nr:glycosyltransferase [Ruminococcus sp.]